MSHARFIARNIFTRISASRLPFPDIHRVCERIIVPEPLQRVAALAGIPALLDELRIEIDEILQGLDLRREDLFADNRIPFLTALHLLDRCAKATGFEHFGALLGMRFTLRYLGPVGEAMASASTLREAIEDFVSIQPGFSQGLCYYLIPFGDCTALGAAVYDRHHEGRQQAYGVAIAAAVNAIRILTNGEAGPLEVHFNHRAPHDSVSYRDLLKCPVLFNQDQSCVLLSRRDFEWNNPRVDAARRERLLAVVKKAAGLDKLPALVRLRHELWPLFSRSIASLDAAAGRLAMHPRALNRRLEQDGTTFVEERDRARFIMARELLDATDLPIGDIAAAVAYENHSAFVRAFRKWSGGSPSDWRDRSKQTHGRGEQATSAE